MTVAEARDLLGVSVAWLYRLIDAGRIRVVEGGRGYGKVTRLVKEDVIREQERRSELLERRLKKMRRS